MAEHTPGEWVVAEYEPHGYTSGGYHGWYVRGPAQMSDGRFVKKVDVRLMAAAPELLTVCEELLDYAERFEPVSRELLNVVELAKVALAKAK